MDRTYALSVPADYDACRSYPLVFAFHGDGGTGASLRDALGLEGPANGGAVFVYPDARDPDRSWQLDLDVPLAQDADTTLFVDIVNKVASVYSVDRSRIFATGFSRGGYFANFLNCRLGTTYLRAIAPQSGSGPYGKDADYDIDGHFMCPAPGAAAFLIHGDADGVVPISPDAEYSRDQWAWESHCAATTTPASPAPCVAYDGCDAGKPVVWCAIPGLDHAPWSEAAAAIWQFFAGFSSASATMHVAGRDLSDATGAPIPVAGDVATAVYPRLANRNHQPSSGSARRRAAVGRPCGRVSLMRRRSPACTCVGCSRPRATRSGSPPAVVIRVRPRRAAGVGARLRNRGRRR
jgi:polyhydroxybutyrate depolymerase